jgi:hypothetical protein
MLLAIAGVTVGKRVAAAAIADDDATPGEYCSSLGQVTSEHGTEPV